MGGRNHGKGGPVKFTINLLMFILAMTITIITGAIIILTFLISWVMLMVAGQIKWLAELLLAPIRRIRTGR